MQFLGCPLLLGLPQVTGDGDGIHARRHGFGWDDAELLPVRVVLVEALDHLGGDGPGPDAGQPGDLLRLWTVGVHGPKLASRIPEQYQEIIGFRFLHFLQERQAISFTEPYMMFLTCRESEGEAKMQNIHQVFCSSGPR